MAQAKAENEKRNQESQYYRTAWAVCHIMNASGNLKRPVTPEKLLGENFGKSQEDKKPVTLEEQAQRLKELKEKFGL